MERKCLVGCSVVGLVMFENKWTVVNKPWSYNTFRRLILLLLTRNTEQYLLYKSFHLLYFDRYLKKEYNLWRLASFKPLTVPSGCRGGGLFWSTRSTPINHRMLNNQDESIVFFDDVQFDFSIEELTLFGINKTNCW